MNCFKRIRKELDDISKTKIEDIIKAGPIKETDITIWIATIRGPKDSPYESGTFDLRIEFPTDYPFKPPKLHFITKIFHPHVLLDGRINACGYGSFPSLCFSEWCPAFTVEKLLIDIINGMKNPIFDECCSFNIVYFGGYNTASTDRNFYNKTAKKWTEYYAIPENDDIENDSNKENKDDINLLKEEISETIKILENELNNLFILFSLIFI